MGKAMMIIADAALIAGAIAMTIVTGGGGMYALGGAIQLTAAQVASLATAMGAMGAGGLLSSISQAMAGGGTASMQSVHSSAAPRKTIYGETRASGVKINDNSNSSHNWGYNQVVAWCSHKSESVDYVYVDGREAYITGHNHQACAGADGYCDEYGHYDASGEKYNFYASSSNNYHLVTQNTLGDGTYLDKLGIGAPPPGGDWIFSGDSSWTSTCRLFGITATYVGAASAVGMFSNFPQIKALIKGKCDLYDPRGILAASPYNHTGTDLAPFNEDGTPNLSCCQWTQNAALIIADLMVNKDFGFAMSWDEINIPQLIAAANLCDTQIPLANAIGTWQANKVYTPGQIIVDSNNRQQQCLGYAVTGRTGIYSGGTSGNSHPTWATSPGSVTQDHDLKWMALNETGNVAAEAMYTINGEFEWGVPGDTLAQMLEAIGGSQCLTYWNGQWNIRPATWYGSSGVSYGLNDLVDKVSFKKTKFRDTCNAVRAKFVCPSYPYAILGYDRAHKDTNLFDGQYQPTDAPEYAQDAAHGYSCDANLVTDGGVKLYQDRSYSFVQSVATCQRLMKIFLCRSRMVWTGTIRVNAKGLRNVPGDVIPLTLPQFGWDGKLFEILEVRHVPMIEDGKPPMIAWEFDLKETDPSIYSWSVAEERSLTNSGTPVLTDSITVALVTGLTLLCDSTTALVNGATVTPRILATWMQPADPFVTSGGSIVIQYSTDQINWLSAAIVSGNTMSYYITGVSAGASYYVRLQAKRANGAASDWVQAGPVSVPGSVVIGAPQLFLVNGA